jgi:N utilization substance protein A
MPRAATKDPEVNIVEALGQVAKEKNIGMDVVLQTLRTSLVQAARKYTGIQKNIEVDIDRDKGSIRAFLRVEVVDDLPDLPPDVSPEDALVLDEKYMLEEQAREFRPGIQIGETLEHEIPIAGFGRAAISIAKQSLTQRVREVERQRVFDDYRDRIGTIVTGTVQQVDRGDILVNLGRTEAIVPLREQIRKERYRQGDSIRAYICDVSNNSKGPQVVLSRTHPEFLAKLFELEVPEIYDEIVEIRAVARDPGFRAKISVSSRTSASTRWAPAWACAETASRPSCGSCPTSASTSSTGPTTCRSTSVSLFAPAEIKKVLEVGGARFVVVVANDDLSLAIGRQGQNVKLATKLLGKELDVFGEDEFAQLAGGRALRDPGRAGAGARGRGSSRQSRKRPHLSPWQAPDRAGRERARGGERRRRSERPAISAHRRTRENTPRERLREQDQNHRCSDRVRDRQGIRPQASEGCRVRGAIRPFAHRERLGGQDPSRPRGRAREDREVQAQEGRAQEEGRRRPAKPRPNRSPRRPRPRRRPSPNLRCRLRRRAPAAPAPRRHHETAAALCAVSPAPKPVAVAAPPAPPPAPPAPAPVAVQAPVHRRRQLLPPYPKNPWPRKRSAPP